MLSVLAVPLLLAIAYLCGSIPTGVWLSRRRGIDPRDIGSGNIGATNVARAAGIPTGLMTLVGDALKGLLPVVCARALGFAHPIVALTGLAAFAGHLYSCFLGFDGGKGVATALGVLIALAPATLMVSVPLFVLVAAMSRYVSLASLAAAAITPPLLVLWRYPPATIAVGVVVVALIAVRHRDNVRRLRFGTEARLGRARRSPVDSELA
jgi:glycerol-3-phosphate acyltransferase PlsY